MKKTETKETSSRSQSASQRRRKQESRFPDARWHWGIGCERILTRTRRYTASTSQPWTAWDQSNHPILTREVLVVQIREIRTDLRERELGLNMGSSSRAILLTNGRLSSDSQYPSHASASDWLHFPFPFPAPHGTVLSVPIVYVPYLYLYLNIRLDLEYHYIATHNEESNAPHTQHEYQMYTEYRVPEGFWWKQRDYCP